LSRALRRDSRAVLRRCCYCRCMSANGSGRRESRIRKKATAARTGDPQVPARRRLCQCD
jgi:hypothetical protein